MFAALGIILLVAGAILTFAVDRQADGVDLEAIGWILLAGGGVALLIGAVQAAGLMSMDRSRMRTERHVSADGRHEVEDVITD